MDKFEERLEEYRNGTSKISRLRLKILEHRYRILKDNALLNATKADYDNEIYNINKEYFDNRVEKKRLETSKLLMYFIVINCSIIEIYCMWAMVHFNDLSSLPTLMGAVITESVSFAVYCAKAYFGKKGEVDAELARENMELEKERFATTGEIPEDYDEEDIEDPDSEDSVG